MVKMAKTTKQEDFIGAKIHSAIRTAVEQFKENTDKSDSEVVRESLTLYLDRHEDVEPKEPVQKIFDQSEELKDAQAEDYYLKKQNFMVSTKLKELTFLEYMDKNLSLVFLANKPHLGESQLEDMLQETLKSLKDRAEHHGFKQQWKLRMEEPIKYANEFLDRKSKESKAFGDFKESIGMK